MQQGVVPGQGQGNPPPAHPPGFNEARLHKDDNVANLDTNMEGSLQSQHPNSDNGSVVDDAQEITGGNADPLVSPDIPDAAQGINPHNHDPLPRTITSTTRSDPGTSPRGPRNLTGLPRGSLYPTVCVNPHTSGSEILGTGKDTARESSNIV